MSEDDDIIVGVFTECPDCGFTVNNHFRRGKELISEFVKALKIIKDNVRRNAATESGLDFFIKKWEKRS